MNDIENYIAALRRYPVLRLLADDLELVLECATKLDSMSVEKRRGLEREYALLGAVMASRDPVSLLEWERDLAKLESHVRPVDMPPGRERAVLGRS